MGGAARELLAKSCTPLFAGIGQFPSKNLRAAVPRDRMWQLIAFVCIFDSKD